MREILFRGKDEKTGKIIFGDLRHFNNEVRIVGKSGYSHIVEPETIGQFTGLTDKNGVKIFEGDIVKVNFPYAKTGFVEFDKKRCSFYVKPTDGFAAYDKGYKMNANKLEIISNIHDKP